MHDSGETLDIRHSLYKTMLLLAGGLVFVAIGIWMLTPDGNEALRDSGRYAWTAPWLPWVTIILFGAGAVAVAYVVVDRRPQVSIGPGGIRYRRWSDVEIPWPEILTVEAKSLRGNTFIVLTLRDPSRYPGRGLLGRVAWLNRWIGFGDLAILTMALDHSAADILAAIERYHGKAE